MDAVNIKSNKADCWPAVCGDKRGFLPHALPWILALYLPAAWPRKDHNTIQSPFIVRI